MPREQKYTKTIAVRVTQEEWKLILFAMERDGHANATAYLRQLITEDGRALHLSWIQAQKRIEAAERRAAKKAADVNA
jgi:hypothetical protein